MIELQGYKLIDPNALETPAMLLFDQHLKHNLSSLCALANGGENLMVHVKTHKSAAVTRRLIDAGVSGFKCATLKELAMCLHAKAPEVIMAYPLAHPLKVERFCDLMDSHPETCLSAVVGNETHVGLLAVAASTRKQHIKVMVDLDVGMHRTGVEPGPVAESLYRSISASKHLDAHGLHAYDGHEKMTDPRQRAAMAKKHISTLLALKGRLEASGLPVPRVIAGGTFSFPYYARTAGMQGSPGTCTYWDFGHSVLMPEMPFRWASAVLTQVVDRHPHLNTITSDLGTKAICSDPPLERRAHLLGLPHASLISQSEEHGVFHIPGSLPQIGSFFLAIPGHVCTTTILYPGSHLIDGDGNVIDYYAHTARDRT